MVTYLVNNSSGMSRVTGQNELVAVLDESADFLTRNLPFSCSLAPAE